MNAIETKALCKKYKKDQLTLFLLIPQLEKDIQLLTAEKAGLESKLNGGLTDHEELQRVSARFSEVSDLLDVAETRWLELSI